MNDIESISMKGSGGSKMPHSHSTPAGVDGGSRTPPTTPRKAGKMLAVRVQMLDDTITMFQVQAKALGRVLFDQVCKQLHLLEADYFGLEYQEPSGTKYWLDLEKPVCRQVGLSLIDPLLRFCVKFYTPDPAQLEEEFTRYLFCLQIKRDLAQGLLQCNDNTAALMASYIVQAECGDYVIEDYPDHTYLSTYKFVPHQDQELERRIMENHKKHAGQSPAEADLNLLETARRCELYGMKMHPAKDHEGVPLNLAVAHMGIVVFQNFTKINTFSWAKIRKISFKRKRFLIKLHPEGYGYYKDTVEFFFEGRNECKNFWKKCVENHGFFRCSVVKRVVRQKTRVLSRGSSFRYSGKTQKQIVEFVRDNYVKRQTFQRSNSFRQTSGGRALQGLEGGGYRGATPSSSLMGSSSISAHPLLPLADPALETPALSLSCGSMTLDSPTTATSVSMGGTIHRRDDTATSFRTLTSIDVHSPATGSQVAAAAAAASAAPRQMLAVSQQRISSAGRISPSNSSPPELFPPPRPMPRHPWQRSASCRDLYASSFEDSGRARIPTNGAKSPGDRSILEPFRLPSQGELDNPVTRYDESNRSYSAASSKLPSLDHDSVPDRVYSSSYPGTSSLSTESGHEESGPAGDLSHDDLSHDSYELLEREHEFEYPESYSSPRDYDDDEEEEEEEEGEEQEEVVEAEGQQQQQDEGEGDGASDRSDEGIEREMFQMDAETDSFVKHRRSIKSTDRQRFGSVLVNSKAAAVRRKSIDRHSAAVPANTDGEYVSVESRIQRTGTQIERRFETRRANSVENRIAALPHQDSGGGGRRDPLVVQVQKQKISVLNELKNLKPKYRIIAHVDSEILRDEGIMRPKSRIDDDSSPGETTGRSRTVRARSIASLEDQHGPPRCYVETGSLGRGGGHRSGAGSGVRDKKTKGQDHRDRRSMERDHSTEHGRKIERLDSRERRRELGRSVERLDRSFRCADSYELRGKSVERLDCQPEYPRERRTAAGQRDRRERSMERLDSREKRRGSGTIGYEQRHTLERFDSGNRSPFETLDSGRQHRGRSVERLDSPSREKHSFDFDPITIERLKSLERCGIGKDRRNSEKWAESRDRRHLDRSDSRASEAGSERRRDSAERESRRTGRGRAEKGKSEEKPRERDDWRSLEKARKDEEKRERERERQARLSVESRTDTVIESAFSEYEPKVVAGLVLGFDDAAPVPGHTAVERTKSDPNPARQRSGSSSKRHILMHQKSIDLTPADSGDEDPFSDSAAVPKGNVEIPYTLHKRHVMNGTASDEKSESDSGKGPKKSAVRDLPRLPLGTITDIACFDLSKLTSIEKASPSSRSPSKPSSKAPSPDAQRLRSASIDRSSRTATPTSKLSPIETPTVTIVSALEKRPSPKASPTDPNATIVSVIQRKCLVGQQRSLEAKPARPLNFADAVGMEMKLKLERRAESEAAEKDRLRTPDASLEKQDSIERIPLPEIPTPVAAEPKDEESKEEPKEGGEEAGKTEQRERAKSTEKPSIPEKTKRILEKIAGSSARIIDTGFDDFVEPVAELPLDEVPVKPALELDSLKVPEFLPFASRPHGEPLRSKSLSLAEEKAPIDTLLSPELETKHFVPDVSPKRASRRPRSEPKKDFRKQSKSLEGDKPPARRAASKESGRGSAASSKIDKSKLKLGEMPQEIIIIDSTDVAPEVSIVQKSRSKSVTRLPERTSASIDEDPMKTPAGAKSERTRPKSLGISKSLGSSTERKDSAEKISPKRIVGARSSPKLESPKSPREETKAIRPREEEKRSPGSQAPVLFARARLGLSEGSGLGALQRQQSAAQSPAAQRRAKSLDAAVIAVHKLPPANAFSSKDDTVDVSERGEKEEEEEEEAEVASSVPAAKPQSIQIEASPNHRSDSTDRATLPEIFTDSLSVTETSAQYLESPLTECNEITGSATDLIIPYEQDAAGREQRTTTLESVKGDERTKFIDQSSVESGPDQEAVATKEGTPLEPVDQPKRSSGDRDDLLPDVTVTAVIGAGQSAMEFEDGQDMVKSPIQISIEECSDEEDAAAGQSDEDREIGDGERPPDSADTSEDTLDALDTQVHARDLVDSELSSPDYGVERMDEKTLVEVELTPEYLEMRLEDGAEELPKDEEEEEEEEASGANRLSIDKKLRLSSERSRSEETSTWTPDREDPESSSCSIARPLGIGQIQPIVDRREFAAGSLDEENGSETRPRAETGATWKSFPPESSGSSSVEEGWPGGQPDEESNGQNEDSFQEDLADFPGSFIYPIGPDILTSCGTFALTRTLSRISERSTTSEQDKSDMEDSFKPSSRSPSLDDESLMSSDHQPSLSSDPPSGTAFPSISDERRTSSELPDIPIDVVAAGAPGAPGTAGQEEGGRNGARVRAQSSEDWPSPPSSPVFEPAVVSQVETTFYTEIKPEEAVKVTVTDSTETTPGRVDRDSDSSDENRTLHDDLHSAFLEDGGQSSASATTVDGTVRIAVKAKSNSHITGSSHSEDTSMGLSMSEWSSSNNTVRQFCQYSGTKSDDNSLAELGPSISDWSAGTTVVPQEYYAAIGSEKSQSDTSTSDKSVTSMRPNSKCGARSAPSPPVAAPSVDDEAERGDRRLSPYAVSPPRITLRNEFDEEEEEEDLRPLSDDGEAPLPILQEEEETEEQEARVDRCLYDNVPAIKYASGERIRVEVGQADGAEDMHEKYADLALAARPLDDEWSFEEEREEKTVVEKAAKVETVARSKFERGYSEPAEAGSRYHETRSTERPVVVPIRAKSTPYYSTTSLSGESTTSSPPMQIRAQIRTKTIPSCTATRSPQSEGDTSSSMESPVHTPIRGQIAVRRRRRENPKRRHRVPGDAEPRIVSSTDSSFDVATVPPPLLPDRPSPDDEEHEHEHEDECSAKNDRAARRRHH